MSDSLFLTVLHVFVVVTDAVKSELVTEGETVTLQTNVSEIQKDDQILWIFGDIVIAEIYKAAQRFHIYDGPDERFRGKLNLDNQTGSLIITDTRITHSGLYEVEIKKTFSVILTVLKAMTDRSVSVLEGDSVTLHTDVPDIQRYDVIQWRFEQEESHIAEINRTAGIFNTFNSADGRFRDRLQLDHQTGSLTIKKTETNHSGRYEVEISSSRSKHTIHKSFTVTVSGEQRKNTFVGLLV
uniref:Immunoglobulin domain-containing protein n=1 Tax=Sinocyclocheilus grahami TaxID=75366 RepID=A0A672KTY4_SINGR